jgi:hypothetical protein
MWKCPLPTAVGGVECGLLSLRNLAPVLAFATVPLAAFVVIHSEPSKRRSSAFGERWFCRDCGSHLVMHVDHQPETIDFTIATLDSPDAVRPAYHIWFYSRIGWFDTADEFPRHPQFRAQAAG